MTKARWKKLTWALSAAAVLAVVAWLFVPAPLPVDVARADRGALRVTVDQDGKTRVKERYVVSAPLAGMLRRIALKVGDEIEAGQTLLASIDPTPPALLDARARQEADARVRAAEAALAQAAPAVDRVQAELQQARIEAQRAQRLAAEQAMSKEEAETRALTVTIREAELKSARFARDVAAFQLDLAKAALARTGSPGDVTPLEIRAPVSGRVLKLVQESQAPVTPGTPLIEVGDVRDLEAVIDVLSRDAVGIRPGAPALLERWGGDQPLAGTVRRIEPAAFTKISALGVEEQRVNVIIDFAADADPPGLGDGYRVDARIVVWEGANVLKVPTGALFRDGDDWAVYAVRDGRAVMRRLRLGRMNGLEAQVLDGLTAGDVVVVHPSDKVKDGVSVEPRKG